MTPKVSLGSHADGSEVETTWQLLTHARADLAGQDTRHQSARLAFDALSAMAASEPTLVAAMDRPCAGTLDRTARLARTVSSDDRDDVHWSSLTHPGSVVWPSCLGVASLATPLATFLDAGALGYQLTVRTAAFLGGRHRQSFHVTTTAATIGATAASGVVLRLDDAALDRALRHAASTLGGTARAAREGSATGSFHRMSAALTAAAAAQAGDLTPAVTRPLDGPAGFAEATGLVLASIESHIDVAVAATTIRRHLVCGFAHTLVDAILQLPQLDPTMVTRIEAHVPEVALAATEPPGIEPPERPGWHLPHVAASALLEPAAPVTALPVEDERARELRRRIDVIPRRAAIDDLRVDLRIEVQGSDAITVTRHAPVGHPTCPLDDADLVAKASERGLAPAACARLLDALLTGAGSVGELPLSGLASDRDVTSASPAGGP